VQFLVNEEPDGPPVALNGTGHVFYSPTFLLDVGDVVTAAYSGDGTYAPSRQDISPIVQPAQTVTHVTAEPGTVVTGGEFAVTTTVTNAMTDFTPFGHVQFLIDGNLLGSETELDPNGQLTVGLVANVPPRDYLLTVLYADHTAVVADFLPSSASVLLHVTAPPPQTPSTQTPTPTAPEQPAVTVVRKQALMALGGSLIRRLKARGFAALTSSLSYTAPGPGTLTEAIYAQVGRASASSARAKQVLIASGRRVFAAAGKGTLRGRLTSAGRRMTKRAKQLKLRIVTSFRPVIGTAVSASQRATIRRRSRNAKPTAAAGETGWSVTAGG
jgi:hypothetical protein